ncbi:MAG: hypothetical protein KJ067_17630 [Vicinamibacteria bacterium]|nr:hypothetical protein [Vicinamibacteria bacterium]
MSCPLCARRKGKRHCPAKGELICAACCGSKRRVEVACPDDCPYLTGSHAGAWDGRETEMRRDARRVGPFLEALDEEEEAPLVLMTIASLPAIRTRVRGLDDAALHQALGALAKTVATREKGILYEHPVEDGLTQAAVRELSGLYEVKEEDGSIVRPRDASLLRVLEALQKAVESTLREASGPSAFLDTATRLAGRMLAEAGGPPPPAAEPPAPRLIVPPE